MKVKDLIQRAIFARDSRFCFSLSLADIGPLVQVGNFLKLDNIATST